MAKADHDDEPNGRGRGYSMVPNPDPTLLTTKLTEREIAALREIVEEKITGLGAVVTSEISGLRSTLETRLNGMDLALQLLQATSDKFPARIDEKIAALQGLHDERFRSTQNAIASSRESVAQQFNERDVRTEKTERDSKVAVDAALQAAKEAVNAQQVSNALSIDKSEKATAKQIDQLVVTMQTSDKAKDEKIDDVKERLTRIEGRDLGATATQTRSTQSNQWAVGVGIGVAGILISIAIALSRMFH